MIMMAKINNEKPWGAFCDLFGADARNRVLEIFLEGPEVDNGLGNVAEESGLSRATVYNVMSGLLEQGLVVPSRIVGRTQLYKLDLNKEEVKALLKAFDLTLKIIEKEVEMRMRKAHPEKAIVR